MAISSEERVGVTLRRSDGDEGDYEAVATDGFTPTVEIVAYSEGGYAEAVSKLKDALLDFGITGAIDLGGEEI